MQDFFLEKQCIDLYRINHLCQSQFMTHYRCVAVYFSAETPLYFLLILHVCDAYWCVLPQCLGEVRALYKGIDQLLDCKQQASKIHSAERIPIQQDKMLNKSESGSWLLVGMDRILFLIPSYPP